MTKAAKPLHDPAVARTHGRVPTYIWTGHETHRSAYQVYREKGTPPNWHLMFTLSGKAFFGQNGVRHTITSEDLILLGPDCEHDYGCEPSGKWEYLYAHFTPRPQWLELMRWPALAPGLHRLHITDAQTRTAMGAAMARCNAYRQSAFSNYAHELSMAALEEVLLLAAHEQSYSGAHPQLSPEIRSVIAYIGSHLTRTHSIPALARMVRLSPSRFSHRFKSETGEAAMSYIIRLRVQRAAALLEFKRCSVKEAAAATGFASEFYFSRQFRRWYLISPSEYKRTITKMTARPAVS